MYRLGIDIGGTKIRTGLFDTDRLTLLAESTAAVSDITDLAAHLADTADALAAECGISRGDITAAGIGIPGTVSDDGRTVLKAPNIAILPDSPADRLEKALGMPVRLVQDSRAAALGEALAGAGQGADTVVCVTLGTGIGTGIVQGGKIYSGALGCAGELGHLPVKENGRPCGCGRTGCLEKYCAGIGFDTTAAEILGPGSRAADLFDAAEAGNAAAADAIREAAEMLGSALVSVINLLSPDCLLFSGGLSNREALYLTPLTDYIRTHCYTAGRMPLIGKAALGERSPLYGAALLPIPQKRPPLLSASIMCADVLHMQDALDEIREAGIPFIHCDIMDNHFVPNLMLPMELLNKFRAGTDLPFDFHLMTEKPETVLEKLDIREGDYVSIHYESTLHLQRILAAAKARGAKASVALNPATPLSVLEEILPEVDMILIMSVNPGLAGQPIVPTSFDKIRRLRQMLDGRGYGHIHIQVDGNCSFENVPKMYAAGADNFVVGTSSVFKKGFTIKEAAARLLGSL